VLPCEVAISVLHSFAESLSHISLSVSCAVVEAVALEEVVEQLLEVSSSTSRGALSANAMGALFAAANTAPVISRRNTAVVPASA